MSKYLSIKKVVESVSITHKFNKSHLYFLNTSDIEKGKIINKQYLPVSELKGQAKKTIKKDDILFSEIRPRNRRFAYVDIDDTQDFVVSTKLMVLRNINPEVDNRYFYYYLTNDGMLNKLQDRAENRICSFPQITFDLLSDYKIWVPDLPIQQKIASILSALDAKIELNNRINAELEAMAKTLYDYWFVQFNFPDKNEKPYKSSGGKMVWNERLKRDIPEKWEAKKLGNLLETSLGGTPSTRNRSYWVNGTINWLNSGEIAVFPIVSSELKITEEAIRNSATELLSKGTTLLSITRHLRPTILAIDACANQSVVGIKENEDIKCYYIYPYLKSEIPRYMSSRTGAQQPHINKEIVDDSLMTIPNKDSDVLKKYNKLAGPLYMHIFINAFQNKNLTNLRDWLLPMLMNGQVKVA